MGAFSGVRHFSADSRRLLLAVYALIATIAFTDWLIPPNISLGFLYLAAITMAAPISSQRHIVFLAVLCTALLEALGPFSVDINLPGRLLMVLAAFLASGLFVRELAVNHRLALERAEFQSRMLVETTLAAAIVTDERGRVTLANEAAHRLFGFDADSLTGQPVDSLLSVRAALPGVGPLEHISRRMVECTAWRRDGEPFFAQVWVGGFPAERGSRLAMLVFDSSQELRDREQDALRSHLADSHVVMGAVWHEVGNICAALGAIRTSLIRKWPRQPEVTTLGTLVNGLQELLAQNDQGRAEQAEGVDPRLVLEELRIILEPELRALDVRARWDIAEKLPPVRATRHGLLQVLLNIGQNSRRALEKLEQRELEISARCERDRVVVRCWNSGPAVPDPQALFKPFRTGAAGHGLGLYISRAMMRGFGGDLRYVPQRQGCCFEVELAIMPRQAGAEEGALTHSSR